MPPILLVLLCMVRLGSSGVPSFNPQTLYQYEYTLDMQIANVARSSIPQTRLEVNANMETYILWRNQTQPEEQLVYLQFNNFTYINKKKAIPNRKEDTTAQHLKEDVKTKGLMLPFLFHWHAGKVIGLYSTGENNNHVLDLKRGLVSLFQFNPQPGTHSEEDALGKCQVTYNVSEDFINKTKDLSSCIRSPFGYEADHQENDPLIAISLGIPSILPVLVPGCILFYRFLGVSWNSSSNGYLLLNGTTFQKAVSQESYNLSANLGSLLGTHITSRQQLELMSSKPGPLEIVGESIEVVLGKLPEKYSKVPFQSHPPIHPGPSDESNLLKKYLAISKRKKLTVPKISTVKHFHALVKFFKYAKQRDIQQIFKAASPDLLPFFIDAAVAAQSQASIFALSDFLDFTKKKQAKIHEKFLYSAAFASQPSIELLKLVLDKLRAKVATPEIMETGIIIAGAIIGKICRMDLCEEEDVELAKATILEGLNNAEDDGEMKIYLLSLKNAQLPETIPTLLQYAEEHTGEVCSTALSALQAFPSYDLSDQEVKDAMKSILHQTHQLHDKKSRLMAAETLLLADCTLEELTNISAGLQLMDIESSKLLISKLHNRLNLQHPLKKLSKNNSKSIFHHNYWYLSQPGRSVVFSGLLTATDDLASTYGADLLFADSGLLKRSAFDITLFDSNHHLKTMQFVVEAQGLEFLIDNEEREDEGEDASVALSTALFDVQLRPVTYFQGYMDLISKVLSASGEPLSTVKGNVLLVDYLQWLPMQSGLQAMVQYQGGLGYDISTNIAVSIWDQQTKANINAKAGLVFELKTEVDTSFFHVDMTAKVEAEGTIDQDTTTTVSKSPASLCMELRHDDIPYRETYIITETYPEAHTTHTVRKGRKSTLRGRDFLFHRANLEMCVLQKAEEEVITKLTA